MIDQLRTARLPKDGLWRVGRKNDPLAFNQPGPPALESQILPRNRFDDAMGHVATSYFSTTAEGAYAETMMPLRVNEKNADLLPATDSIGAATLPAAYRDNRLLVQAAFRETDVRPNLRFVDLEDAENLALLSEIFRSTFETVGVPQVTLAEIHSHDRTVTATISSTLMYATDSSGIPLYAGARYFSKYGADFENWVVYDGVEPILLSARPIELTDPDLTAAAHKLKLQIH